MSWLALYVEGCNQYNLLSADDTLTFDGLSDQNYLKLLPNLQVKMTN